MEAIAEVEEPLTSPTNRRKLLYVAILLTVNLLNYMDRWVPFRRLWYNSTFYFRKDWKYMCELDSLKLIELERWGLLHLHKK